MERSGLSLTDVRAARRFPKKFITDLMLHEQCEVSTEVHQRRMAAVSLTVAEVRIKVRPRSCLKVRHI